MMPGVYLTDFRADRQEVNCKIKPVRRAPKLNMKLDYDFLSSPVDQQRVAA